MSRSILIFGLGYVSSFLIEELGKLNWVIYCTSRSVELKKPTKKGNVTIINFLDPDLPAIIKSTDIILSTAPPNNEIIDPVLHTYTSIISATQFHWIGYLSSTSVYGNYNGAWVNEQTKCNPSNEKSKIRLLAEKQWLDLCVNHKMPIHILRLSGIYGPNRNCLEQIKKGKDFTILKKDQYFSRIHVEDICRAIIASINSPSAGKTFNISDDMPAPLNIVQQLGAKILGKEPLQEVSFENAGLSEQARFFFHDNKKVSNQKIKKQLDFQFKYPSYHTGLLNGCIT